MVRQVRMSASNLKRALGFLGSLKSYYVKGIFFDRGNLKGVEIQSFREEKSNTLRFKIRR